MTGRDKEFINRIQLQQLASGDPFADDFYYQVFSAIRQRAGLPPPGVNKDPLMEAKARDGDRNKRSNRREENAMHKMQQQVQRIVNDAKRRPKQTQCKWRYPDIVGPFTAVWSQFARSVFGRSIG